MVYVLLADGFEEIEALTVVDVLRRADVDIKTVGMTGSMVHGGHRIVVQADCMPQDVVLADMEMLVLPGGLAGANTLRDSATAQEWIAYCAAQQRYIAAICAAPSVVLGETGLLSGRSATCYPGMESGMKGATVCDARVCADGKYITGRAAGSALDFALALCTALKGQAVDQRVRGEIFYDG